MHINVCTPLRFFDDENDVWKKLARIKHVETQ